jgi:hypothetical protein
MSRRSKIGEIEVPEDEDADFERVMNHLGLIAYRTVRHSPLAVRSRVAQAGL